MTLSVDDIDPRASGTPFAFGLSVMLKCAIIFLSLIVIGMIVFGLSMFTGGGLQSMVYSELENADKMISPQKFGFAFLGGALITAAWIYVLYLLRQIVGTLLSGDPFVPPNISRLRKVWITLASAEVLRMFMYGLMAPALMSLGGGASSSDITGQIDIRIGSWFLVFVIAALAEVFRHGAVLRRDQALTV